MTRLFHLFFLISALLIPVEYILAEGFVSCECPAVDCPAPCLVEKEGLDFYTEKCGPGGQRVRSCAKQACVPADPLPPSCQVKASPADPGRAPASQKEEDTPSVGLPPARGPAKNVDAIAEVRQISGAVWLTRAGQKKVKMTLGMALVEGDLLTSEAQAKAKLLFNDGNEIVVTESSQLKIELYENKEPEHRKAVLDLIRGQVRNKVRQKYDGKTSFYKVKTKSAVAGVRGTDFVVTYEAGENLVSSVTTFTGEVQFSGREAYKGSPVQVKKGERAQFVVPVSSSVFSDEELNGFIAKGYMTPVYGLSPGALAELDRTSGWSGVEGAGGSVKERRPANICKNPAGAFNQCLWTCENNPKGSKFCRTELPRVQCVRKRCDASGKWADLLRLPASYHDSCPAHGDRIAPCDY